ncbi:MAG: hypothetical protein ACRC30_08295 [Clostridium sp.]
MEKFTKKEVAKVLNKGYSTIKSWTNEKIEEELKKSCYKLIEAKKEGRAIYYYCDYQEYNMSNEEYLKEEFNIENVHHFKNYSKTKITNIEEGNLMTRKQLCKITDTKITTSENWDKKLIDKGILQKDGYIYICMNIKTKERCIVDKQAYTNFWLCNAATKKALGVLYREKQKNRISQREYEYLRDSQLIQNDTMTMYYKVSKNVVKYDNYLTSLIMS